MRNLKTGSKDCAESEVKEKKKEEWRKTVRDERDYKDTVMQNYS